MTLIVKQEGVNERKEFKFPGLASLVPEEEAKVLSEIGYGGVSQISGDPLGLRQMVAAYRKEGLRVETNARTWPARWRLGKN